MMSSRLLRQRAATIFGCLLAFTAMLAGAEAQQLHKSAVVSFGLFGGQDVFRSEASGLTSIRHDWADAHSEAVDGKAQADLDIEAGDET